MRILFVSPYPPAPDGIGDYTKSLAGAMAEAGHEVRVVIPYSEPEISSEVIGSLTATGRLDAQLRDAIASWSPDVVHVQFAIAAFGTRTIALIRWLTAIRRDLRMPIVVTLHEFNRERALIASTAYAIHRSVIRRCDHLVLHSDQSRRRFESEVMEKGPKPTVIPHPTVASKRKTASGGQELRTRFGLETSRILLAFGFIHIDKGLEDLIDALQIIRQHAPEVFKELSLVIAGDVRPRHGLFRAFEIRDVIYRSRLIHRIRDSKLQGSVVLTGYVPHDEVAAWFGLADAAVLPYRRAEQSGVESLARSFKLPVLASTVGGLGQHSSDARWSFPPRSPSCIAETIVDFLAANPAEKQNHHAAPEDPTDLSVVVAKTLKLYASVQRNAGSGNARVAHA